MTRRTAHADGNSAPVWHRTRLTTHERFLDEHRGELDDVMLAAGRNDRVKNRRDLVSVLRCLVSSTNRQGVVSETQAQIAAKLDMKPAMVGRCMRLLGAAGWIELVRAHRTAHADGMGRAATYRVTYLQPRQTLDTATELHPNGGDHRPASELHQSASELHRQASELHPNGGDTSVSTSDVNTHAATAPTRPTVHHVDDLHEEAILDTIEHTYAVLRHTHPAVKRRTVATYVRRIEHAPEWAPRFAPGPSAPLTTALAALVLWSTDKSSKTLHDTALDHLTTLDQWLTPPVAA